MRKIFKHLRFLYKRNYFKIQLALFKKIISSRNAWQIFDTCNIPGFGTNLLRTYFPIYNSELSSNSFSTPVTKQLEILIKNNQHHIFEADIITEINQLLALPDHEIDETTPYLDNYFFGVFDAAILGTLMLNFKPKCIVEIGSGISTRYVNFFNQKYKLTNHITCIDPFPRVEIKEVADNIYNMPLENAIDKNLFELSSGDFLFMDGSHYVFQGNDTLAFFFRLLPSLPSGVIIHIHDIYLPYDYDNNVSKQLWTEQYILAAMIMNGLQDYEILYPAYYESRNNETIKNALNQLDKKLKEKNFEKRKSHHEGFSFWMQKK